MPGGRDQAWGEAIIHMAIDVSVTYAEAVRGAPPHAQLIADRFHLVKRTNQMVEAVPRRITWDSRGCRGPKASGSGSTGAAAARR